MSATYEQIEHAVLNSPNNTVSFTNIPATYTDLVIIASPLGYANNNGDINLQFNSDTTSNYSYGRNVTSGSSLSSNATNATIINNSDATQPGVWRINIFNYANTSYWKQATMAGGDTSSGGGNLSFSVGVWRNTAAITSVQLRAETSTGTWATNSTFTLYGIKAK